MSSAFNDSHKDIIYKGVRNLGSEKACTFFLEQLYSNEALTLDEQLPYIHFLYLAGKHKTLLEYFQHSLEKGFEISWFHWALIVYNAKVEIEDEQVEALEFLLAHSSSTIPMNQVTSFWPERLKMVSQVRPRNLGLSSCELEG